jgi:hypothetical protein
MVFTTTLRLEIPIRPTARLKAARIAPRTTTAGPQIGTIFGHVIARMNRFVFATCAVSPVILAFIFFGDIYRVKQG